MTDDLSPEQLKAIGTIERLLRLAARNNSPEEAASAQNKAQELMIAYNLDQVAVEANTGDTGKRSDEKLKGGHFEFERDLWREVAKLNFCIYMSITEIEKTWGMAPRERGRPDRGFVRQVIKEKRVRQHRIVGRTVNTRATRVMAEYLEQAVERILTEALIERFGEADALGKLYSTWANSFREGAIEVICEKIYDRAAERMSAERQKQEEQARAAREAGMDGVSTATAITISSFTKAEKEANEEFVDPGITERRARWAAQDADARAKRAAALAAADAAHTAWAAANPEAARLEEARARKLADEERKREERNAKRRTGYRYQPAPAYKGDWSARKVGRQRGQDVSIDRQADDNRAKAYLG